MVKRYARVCGMEKAVNDALTGHEGGEVQRINTGLGIPFAAAHWGDSELSGG